MYVYPAIGGRLQERHNPGDRSCDARDLGQQQDVTRVSRVQPCRERPFLPRHAAGLRLPDRVIDFDAQFGGEFFAGGTLAAFILFVGADSQVRCGRHDLFLPHQHQRPDFIGSVAALPRAI